MADIAERTNRTRQSFMLVSGQRGPGDFLTSRWQREARFGTGGCRLLVREHNGGESRSRRTRTIASINGALPTVLARERQRISTDQRLAGRNSARLLLNVGGAVHGSARQSARRGLPRKMSWHCRWCGQTVEVHLAGPKWTQIGHTTSEKVDAGGLGRSLISCSAADLSGSASW